MLTNYDDVDPTSLSAGDLATLADDFSRWDTHLTDLNKQVAEAKAQRSKVKTLVLSGMHAHGMVSVGGHIATVSRRTKRVPTVFDWDELRRYIVANEAWELLHRRVAESAVTERWDAGEVLPGINGIEVETLSVTKVPQRSL
jgi:hypothetical protein